MREKTGVFKYIYLLFLLGILAVLCVRGLAFPEGEWGRIFRLYGAEAVGAVGLFVLGMVSIGISFGIRFRYQKKNGLWCLALGVSMLSLWLLVNSVFGLFFYRDPMVVSDMQRYLLLLLPFPFFLYMDGIQKKRYRVIYAIAEGFWLLEFLCCVGLRSFLGMDDGKFTGFVIIVCGFAVMLLALCIGMDAAKGEMRDYREVVTGFFGAAVSLVMQTAAFSFGAAWKHVGFLEIGFLWFLCFGLLAAWKECLADERKKAQTILARESRGRFLSNMSHEIRTPINAVLGMDAVILRESREPAIREYALDIKNAGQTLLSLINDILDLSKIESGEMELSPVRYDLGNLLCEVLSVILIRAQDKGLNVRFLIEPSLPTGLYGDDVRLRQILTNLMNNAVKYTEKGTVTLVARRKKGEAEQGDRLTVHFEVRDTGAGIKTEDLGKLFEEFERLDEEESRYIEGTGIGMSITRDLLDMMGSRLQVDSAYGEGSVFFFEVEQGIWKKDPIGDLNDRILRQEKDYVYQAAFQAPDARILVTDDNAMNRKVFRGLLKETRIQMDEASGGREALDAIKETHYDLIFLDHMMPEMDGIETLHRIQSSREHLCQDTPVIVLTANAVSGAREMYMDEGFQGYLSKPVDPDRLEEVLLRELPKERILQTERRMEELTETDDAEEAVEFPEIDGMEWGLALHKMKDARLLYQTAKDFYDLNEAEAMTLERFLQQVTDGEAGALGEFRIKVHSMKSSAALIGAMGVSALARVLEHAAADGKRNLIRQVTPSFLEEWRDLKQKMSVMFPESGQEKKAPDYFMLLEYMKLLKAAIADMDIDTSDEIIRQLKMIQYTEEEEKYIEELAVAVAEIDAGKTIGLAEILEEQFMQHT